MSQYQELSGYKLLLKRAQEHRDNPTSSEQRLLTALTNLLPELEFQFQVVMVPFIVDFVSIKKKVIIEVDGKSHIGHLDSDRTRQFNLEKDGYSFMRFSHQDVLNSIELVIAEIKEFCNLSVKSRRKRSSACVISLRYEKNVNNQLVAYYCVSCSQQIAPHEPRFRHNIDRQKVNWIHKKCREGDGAP